MHSCVPTIISYRSLYPTTLKEIPSFIDFKPLTPTLHCRICIFSFISFGLGLFCFENGSHVTQAGVRDNYTYNRLDFELLIVPLVYATVLTLVLFVFVLFLMAGSQN